MSAYVGRDNLDTMEVATNYNRWLVSLAARHFAARSRILDFGAGTGRLTQLLRDLSFEMMACEPDPAMSQIVARTGIPTVQDLAAVPKAAFDGVVSMNVLEHIEDDASALVALRTKLRPGGRLFIYVPAFPLLFSSMDRQVGHFRRYRRGPLVKLLERCGFRVDDCRYADSLGFAAALAYRMMGSRSGLLSRGWVARYDHFVFPLSQLLDSVTRGTFGKNLLAVASATD
ncbi:MAG TPA: class I SAM-dependent methyltransferase [Terriglobales bacterium]|nr:class I SAM-dependent methyltransferase [Terriglobales bacterium]